MTYLLLAAAAAILLWPSQKATQPPIVPDLSPVVDPKPMSPSYSSSLEAISHVRSRLVYTGKLTDAEIEAINTLTLALVSGGDKQ